MKKLIKKLLREGLDELYDSPEAKKQLNVSPEELKKMVAMDFDNSFEIGKYHGKNSADLNQNIANQRWSNKYREDERFGILDHLYKITVSSIPEFKKFSFPEFKNDKHLKFNLNREIILDVANLDDDYSIKTNLWVTYNFTDDDVFDERKTGTLNVLFSPQIITSRTSIGLGAVGGHDVDSIIVRLDKLLYGSPDKEDIDISNTLKISFNGITPEEYKKTLPQIRENLLKFSKFVYGKYGIKIL